MVRRWICIPAFLFAILIGWVLNAYLNPDRQPSPTCVATRGITSGVPVTGLSVTTSVSSTPVTVAFFSIAGPNTITLSNTNPTTAITVTDVTLLESIDGQLKRKTELPAGCSGFMSITSNGCFASGSPTAIAPGGNCTIDFAATKPQDGRLIVVTNVGTLELPIVVN